MHRVVCCHVFVCRQLIGEWFYTWYSSLIWTINSSAYGHDQHQQLSEGNSLLLHINISSFKKWQYSDVKIPSDRCKHLWFGHQNAFCDCLSECISEHDASLLMIMTSLLSVYLTLSMWCFFIHNWFRQPGS